MTTLDQPTPDDVIGVFDSLSACQDRQASWLAMPDPDLFAVAPAVSQWSPAHHVHHLALTELSVLGLVGRLIDGGGRPSGGVALWARGHWARGVFPAGGRSRSAALTPPTHLERAVVEGALRRARTASSSVAARAEDLARARGRARHPFYGALNAAQWVRFLVVHADHHVRISEAVADRTGRSL